MRAAEEFTVWLVTAASLLLFTRRPFRITRHILLILLWIGLVYHAVAEGPHWQLAPVYLAAVLVTIAVPLAPSSVRLRRDTGTTCLLFVAFTIFLCHCVPMIEAPVPTGAFATGTRIVHVIDPSQREADGKPRELVVQAWYPADCPQHSRWVQWLFPYLDKAPYRRWKEATIRSSYQRFLWTPSCPDAKVHAGSYPVLIFNPPNNGRRAQNTFLAEELASHGYIALDIDHPYSTGPVELADGRVIDIPRGPYLYLSQVGAQRGYRNFDRMVDLETVDTLFVLDQLAVWQNDPANPFHDSLNLKKIGTIGYSLGGSVAAEVAVRDSRIGAVFDMSGRLFSSARKRGVATPFFYLSEIPPKFSDAEFRRLLPDDQVNATMVTADMVVLKASLPRNGGYFLELPTGNHSIFSDQPLFSPYPRLGGADPVQTKILHSAIDAYAVAFFDQELKGQVSPLLTHPPEMAGTDWQVYPRPQDNAAADSVAASAVADCGKTCLPQETAQKLRPLPVHLPVRDDAGLERRRETTLRHPRTKSS